jgi:uncharacterized protein YuzE
MQERKIKYDADHDVLYVFLGEPHIGYEDEVSPGIFLRKSESTDEVIGVIIMNFTKKNKRMIQNILPFNMDVAEMRTDHIH